jgi:tRNA nucleotidyltransferase (CCA-adding enzyme)
VEVIATHENTDFDALASLLAASKLYPHATPVLPRRMNRNVQDFVTLYWEQMPFRPAEDLPRKSVAHLILVDTQTVPSLRGIGKGAQLEVIDHHPPSPDLAAGVTFSFAETGATTTVLVEQISHALIPVSPLEATLFLLGIYEDTGSLSYITTTPRDARAAAWLLDRHANLEVVNRYLRYPLTDKQRALYNQLVENSETLEFAGQIIVVAPAVAHEYVEEVSTLAHKLRDLLEPNALFVLVQMDDHVQIVARSTTDSVNVAEAAAFFGGGGHSRAAAALVHGRSVASVKQDLVAFLQERIVPAVTVGEIMSFGVHTLTPDTTIAEAADLMTRYGHEGFPVVAQGKVAGIITRREVDRALHHKLGGATVRLYMTAGNITVTPDDSVEELRQIMVENRVGQVPVVRDNQVIGIVTRTDLLKLWTVPPNPRRAEIAAKLTHSLPPSLLRLIQDVGREAEEMQASAYLVGGFVRDLLLGIPNFDIDFVVEGDAIRLARRLSRKHGGRVRIHSKFKTANWLLEDMPNGHPDFPGNVDFATARTEFYEEPTVLPKVERSSIKQDLHRRDFTINTLAVRVDPEHFGELLDFYGGETDLKHRIIRVLHSLSFVEDPTRMLRAARFETRMEFHMEPRTEELLRNAVELLDRVTGPRILHELFLILEEKAPEDILCRLESLGILRHVSPSLNSDEWLIERFRRLRDEAPPWDQELSGEPLRDAYLALLASRLPGKELEAFVDRHRFGRHLADLLPAANALLHDEKRLAKRDMKPSEVCRILDAAPLEAVRLLWYASGRENVRRRVEDYVMRLRYVRPSLTGHDLKALGLQPGPLYKNVLAAVLTARLDGEVSAPEEEKALVERILAEGRELPPAWPRR